MWGLHQQKSERYLWSQAEGLRTKYTVNICLCHCSLEFYKKKQNKR